MRLTLIRGDSACDNGRTCPHVSATDRGTLVVQGYLISGPMLPPGLGIPAGEIAVEIPLPLLPWLLLAAGPLIVTAGVSGHDTVVTHGPALTDAGTLAELAIPPGEAAIEIPALARPRMEVTADA